jgi:hypothetical protein
MADGRSKGNAGVVAAATGGSGAASPRPIAAPELYPLSTRAAYVATMLRAPLPAETP